MEHKINFYKFVMKNQKSSAFYAVKVYNNKNQNLIKVKIISG